MGNTIRLPEEGMIPDKGQRNQFLVMGNEIRFLKVRIMPDKGQMNQFAIMELMPGNGQ